MMEVLPKLNLRFNISQGLRRGFPTKALPMRQVSTEVRCLTLIHKEEKVVVLMLKYLVKSGVRIINKTT